jgi:hypothetical protein
MRTDDLIAELAARPWPATRPAFRLAVAIIAGWAIALIGFVLALGPPLAAVAKTGSTPFALKLGYTLSLTIITAAVVLAAGRPGQRLGSRAMLIGLPVAVIVAATALELSSTPSARWDFLLFGSTTLHCIGSIAIASVPVLLGVIWAFRTLAPTQLRLAGFLAGLSAGAAGALAFALYCEETTASFLLASYTPGMLIPAIIGALLGPRLLRW